MYCPECHTAHEPEATVCNSCGLILISSATAPKRRVEDLASARRRAADQMVPCQFCKADIRKDSIRCKHCGEIVNEDYYRQRAQRIRARVNYASWVAYLFGLAALLVFRPVGLLSVAAGLLLSIVYYAIPVEPPSIAGRKKIPLSERLRRQLKFERVAIPIPHFKSKKLIFVGTPLVAALIGYSANTFLLQEPMNQVLKENSAFNGMHVRAHYEYWIVPGVVVYDLRDLSVRQTPIDVHTAFLEFAQKLRDRKFTRVQLSYRGNTRFEIDGASFRQLGNEYAKRNFDYVLYKFPQLFQPTQPSQINKTDSARDALVQFHREWYGRDLLTRTVANGL
jgi:predicted nucleic acid-binding Zn ribbon protein